MQDFSDKQSVQIRVDSSVHSAMPFAKYNGFSGTITGKRGAAFEVTLKDGGISRTLVVGTAHLKVMGAKA